MRIVVDHSGYDLLNLGDIAMLQSCVQRFQRLLPDAELHVLCHDPEQLQRYCPGTAPIVLETPLRRIAVAHRADRALIQLLKTLPASPGGTHPLETRLTKAVKSADAVVASGGGYINDSFWWHGAAVLSTLSIAQRRGIPTAMFGQGIGPVTNALVVHNAKRVFPRLHSLTLREGRMGPRLASSFGAHADRVETTGDDAIPLAQAESTSRPASRAAESIGLNLRIVGYTGTNSTVARDVVAAIGRYSDRGVEVLPVSRYANSSDFESTTQALDEGGVRYDGEPLDTPAQLQARTGRCAAVVTSSYHVAVFACAQGIPAVCLVGNAYYSGKFEGLQQLFPQACTLVPLAGADLPERVADALETALAIAPESRKATIEAARLLGLKSDAAYERFVSDLTR